LKANPGVLKLAHPGATGIPHRHADVYSRHTLVKAHLRVLEIHLGPEAHSAAMEAQNGAIIELWRLVLFWSFGGLSCNNGGSPWNQVHIQKVQLLKRERCA
jgi:hypothetical protein